MYYISYILYGIFYVVCRYDLSLGSFSCRKAELLGLSLSFHLACGSVSEILQCLTELNGQ